MTTTSTGRQAENAAAEYLRRNGFEVVTQNWRTRWCEIDIVATKGTTAYCVEVKYRSHASQGTGLEYITTKKQSQMRFAAELWVAQHHWKGGIVLSAIEVSGPEYRIDEFIESIE